MPDDDSGAPVDQEPVNDRPDSESINPPAPPDHPAAPATQEISRQEIQSEVQGIEDRVKRAERWMIYLTGAIAFFGLCSVFVGILQWNAMKGQLQEMKGGGVDTHSLAEAAKIQSKNTHDLAVAANKATETAASTLHLDERAWIAIERGDFQWKIGDEMFFPSRVINTGKTPAEAVEVIATSTTITSKELPEFSYEPGTGHPTIHSRSQLLYGSGSSPILFKLPVYKRGTRSGEILKLTSQLLTDMNNGDAYVVSYGQITYRDIFGIDHWTHFCELYPTNGRTQSRLSASEVKCIAYNDIDKSN